MQLTVKLYCEIWHCIWWYPNHPICWWSNLPKLSGFHQYFAFCGLCWEDIEILTWDLRSPENFTSGDTQTIPFGGGQFFQKCCIFSMFFLLWFGLRGYSNCDSRSEFSWKFRIWWYINHGIWKYYLFWTSSEYHTHSYYLHQTLIAIEQQEANRDKY